MRREQAQYLRWVALVRATAETHCLVHMQGETMCFRNERTMLDYFFWYDDFQLYGPSFPKLNYPEFTK